MTKQYPYSEENMVNVVRNLADEIEHCGSYNEVMNELEVNWLESTDEWVINCGDEILFDGLTEDEARKLEDNIHGRVEKYLDTSIID